MPPTARHRADDRDRQSPDHARARRHSTAASMSASRSATSPHGRRRPTTTSCSRTPRSSGFPITGPCSSDGSRRSPPGVSSRCRCRRTTTMRRTSRVSMSPPPSRSCPRWGANRRPTRLRSTCCARGVLIDPARARARRTARATPGVPARAARRATSWNGRRARRSHASSGALPADLHDPFVDAYREELLAGSARRSRTCTRSSASRCGAAARDRQGRCRELHHSGVTYAAVRPPSTRKVGPVV